MGDAGTEGWARLKGCGFVKDSAGGVPGARKYMCDEFYITIQYAQTAPYMTHL